MTSLIERYARFTKRYWSEAIVTSILLVLCLIELKPLSLAVGKLFLEREALPIYTRYHPLLVFGTFQLLFFLKRNLVNIVVYGKPFAPKSIRFHAFLLALTPRYLIPKAVGALFQELIFRKLLLESILEDGWSLTVALIFQSAIFSIMHFFFGSLFTDSDEIELVEERVFLQSICHWFVSGLFYGIVYIASGSVWVAAGYHILNNYLHVVFSNYDMEVVLEIYRDKGYVYRRVNDDMIDQVYFGQKKGEWLSLKKARTLAQLVSKRHFGIPIVEQVD